MQISLNKIILTSSLLTLFTICLLAQGKKTMNSSVYTEWNRISNTSNSKDCKWISYELIKEEKDALLIILNTESGEEMKFPRASRSQITEDGKLLTALIQAPKERVKELKRKKTKKDDLPKDTILIVSLETGKVKFVPNVSDYKVSKKMGSLVAYKAELPNYKTDTLALAADIRKQTKENGSNLVIYIPGADQSDTLHYIKDYTIAEEAPIIYAVSNGKDSVNSSSILRYDGVSRTASTTSENTMFEYSLSASKDGSILAYTWTNDSTSIQPKHRSVSTWQFATNIDQLIVDRASNGLKPNWYVPENSKISFSEDGKRFTFGAAPIPIVQDTNLLEDEIVKVEVWHHNDPYLYTMQEARLSRDREKTYAYVYDFASGRINLLHDETTPALIWDDKKLTSSALALDPFPYLKAVTWEGSGNNDLYSVNVNSGERKLIAKKASGFPRLSPNGEHTAWFDSELGLWQYYKLGEAAPRKLIDASVSTFTNELNDVPDKPNSYGLAAWATDNKHVLIYDRYDIWQINFETNEIKKLTNGRASKMKYRLMTYDQLNEDGLDLSKSVYLHLMNEVTKETGYATYNPANGRISTLEQGAFTYDDEVKFNPNNGKIITKRQSFSVFPDMIVTDTTFSNMKRITNANPQQKDYNWGTIEHVKWTNGSGELLSGLLVKPENFNPTKKYPLLVNFYERSSDDLYQYRAPAAGRSSINYTFYANKGYMIFNPDITYTDKPGYPGESCLEDLMSGLDAVIAQGQVDTSRMALQGHSWGGYQVAYLLTKTNRFKCAEAGAPVVNMVSAYGGIRWESGMSRMFQYEKTQSRIGQTLWENPKIYHDNSPIYEMEKVQTPVLILHNDEDGAVPWYQGIEYYMALRRLGKETWLLNYNGEPHWPVKWQNRLDFNIRMEQFFDHYLMDKPMPEWMVKGIPAKYKGIISGY